MKQIYILVFKTEAKNPNSINGFFDRKEMMQYEADNLNLKLSDKIWILSPEF